jgi:hypothetical protein
MRYHPLPVRFVSRRRRVPCVHHNGAELVMVKCATARGLPYTLLIALFCCTDVLLK